MTKRDETSKGKIFSFFRPLSPPQCNEERTTKIQKINHNSHKEASTSTTQVVELQDVNTSNAQEVETSNAQEVETSNAQDVEFHEIDVDFNPQEEEFQEIDLNSSNPQGVEPQGIDGLFIARLEAPLINEVKWGTYLLKLLCSINRIESEAKDHERFEGNWLSSKGHGEVQKLELVGTCLKP
ncbi:hypothetical protein FRX31_025515, partial [Thalictrum thalictroides]